jgi:hypothetical protein
MADVLPTTSKEQGLLVKSTAPRYYQKASDLTIRRQFFLAFLQRYGMVEYNASDYSLTWNAEFSLPQVSQYADAGALEFSEHDALQQYTTDIRGYIATDRLSYKKKVLNSGGNQLYDLKANKPILLSRALQKAICRDIYVDGGATGNEERLEGLETFLTSDGNATTADLVAVPSDTYAGQSTALNTTGVSWDANNINFGGITNGQPNSALGTSWPFGRESVQQGSEYDWNSPLLVNINSVNWPSGSPLFSQNCSSVLRQTRIWQEDRGAKGEDSRVPFIHMLSSDLYSQVCEFFEVRTRIIQPHKEASNLGFHNTLNFEGDIVHFEHDVPTGKGYGLSPAMHEMFVAGPQKRMFYDMTEFDLKEFADLWALGCFANFRHLPKMAAKYDDFVNNA